MFTMASAREARPRYDEQYKQLFAFPRMVEDLLRAFVGDQLGASDFSTLRKLSSDYISDALLTRRGDTVWRLRTGPLFIPTWRIETWLAYLG